MRFLTWTSDFPEAEQTYRAFRFSTVPAGHIRYSTPYDRQRRTQSTGILGCHLPSEGDAGRHKALHLAKTQRSWQSQSGPFNDPLSFTIRATGLLRAQSLWILRIIAERRA